jgi:sec-independent protein translocase protein TatC
MTEDRKLPFMKHLEELRTRILLSLLVVLTVFIGCFTYSEPLFQMLMFPVRTQLEVIRAFPFLHFTPSSTESLNLVFVAPAEALWVHLKIALIAAVMLTSPVLFLQVWLFIAPGLHERERRFAVPFVLITSGLFLIGTLFCFLLVLPFAMDFLLNFRTEALTPMLSIERYTDFCLKFMLAFGIVFELPVVIVFLTRSGIVTVDALTKNRKYAVLLAFIAAAILTPTPDAFNQTLMAGPIILLYEAGILASKVFASRRARRQEE